jgi:hypothetical protein
MNHKLLDHKILLTPLKTLTALRKWLIAQRGFDRNRIIIPL